MHPLVVSALQFPLESLLYPEWDDGLIACDVQAEVGRTHRAIRSGYAAVVHADIVVRDGALIGISGVRNRWALGVRGAVYRSRLRSGA